MEPSHARSREKAPPTFSSFLNRGDALLSPELCILHPTCSSPGEQGQQKHRAVTAPPDRPVPHLAPLETMQAPSPIPRYRAGGAVTLKEWSLQWCK